MPGFMSAFALSLVLIAALLHALWNVVAKKAGGDSRFVLNAGLLSQWGIMLFGAWLLGTHLGLGLIGVWIALILDEWLRGLYMLQRWRGGRWLRHARRMQAEAAARPTLDGLQSRTFT